MLTMARADGKTGGDPRALLSEARTVGDPPSNWLAGEERAERRTSERT